MSRRKYTCKECGGPVKITVADQTSQKEGQKARGLGTFRCLNGCSKRRFSVTKFTGSGKEQERNRIESVPVRRAIAVRVQNKEAA